MLRVGSALKGYAIMASDGEIGTVGDLLFDDKTWTVRWLVGDTGSWLTGRQTLIQPSAIVKTDCMEQVVTVSLTKAQVKNSPNILTGQPVSRQMQNSLFEYYGWDPLWGGSRFERGVMASPLQPSRTLDTALRNATSFEAHLADEDPDLRSMIAVTGYHCNATDGAIGHLQDVLIDDDGWAISYLIIDTANWWIGKHVLLSPHAVKEFNWSSRHDRAFRFLRRGQGEPAMESAGHHRSSLPGPASPSLRLAPVSVRSSRPARKQET